MRDETVVEIRVHGIGDHRSLSAIGDGVPIGATPPGVVGLDDDPPGGDSPPGLVAFQPPAIPPHPLVLVNWSRTSRRLLRAFWYLALPFTLLNVAGHMTPATAPDAGSYRRQAHAVSCLVAGLTLSVAVTLWLIVVLETVTKYTPGVSQLGNQLALTGATSVFACGVVTRCRRVHAEQHASHASTPRLPGLEWWHGGAILSFGLVAAWWQPAQRMSGPDPADCASGLICDAMGDPAVLVAVATSAVMGVCAVALIAGGRPDRGTAAAPTASGSGAALVVVLALALVHAAGSLTRIAVDWLLSYPTRYPVVQEAFDLTAQNRFPGLDASQRSLLPRQAAAVFPVDAVASFAVAVVSALALAVLVNLLLQTSPDAAPSVSSRVRRSLRIHDFVSSLPRSTSAVLATTVVISAVLWTVLTFAFDRPLGWMYAVVVTTTHLLAAVAFVVALAGQRFYSLRTTLGLVADVSGFWPVVWHPLSGRSYRDDVVDGLSTLVAGHRWSEVALVGHSQGSVISAWLLGARGLADGKSIHLVTCGSPLRTLYATFFPEYFGKDFFGRVSRDAASWLNVWRPTDPIASTLPPSAAGVEEVRIDDTCGPLKGHSDYWTEEQVTRHVRSTLLAGREPLV